jgi:hypothetical protein
MLHRLAAEQCLRVSKSWATTNRKVSAPAEFAENLFVVLAERWRRRVNARTAVGEGERGDRHAEPTLHSGDGGVAVNDTAGRQLWIGDGFSHRAHPRGRDVVRLQERLPSSAVRVSMISVNTPISRS